ncbi:SPOSA6832_04275 [Sporobolomyces salmonicolor]|uniref:DNA replication complex GINS protein PSF2 n=1 Tax=Sporidiobolus salmonicolor TaxID=5005 RepID=A0A0D6ESA7_SPOSA|nr:SPOSA6832_04275 [Sporobolomyces salmonicolor]
MSIHPTRRRGPLPLDIEFASLDGVSSGWSYVESTPSAAAKGKGRDTSERSAGGGRGEVEIVPLVRMGVVEGLDGPSVTYGPLTPPQKASVPLWLAVHLKKKRKCRIIAPGWMSVLYLEQILREETTQGDFSDLPRDYLEVSKVLLEVASDDLPAPDRLRLLLKDIREARQAKVREGLGAVNAVHLGMPNLSTLELSELRPFFALSFQRLMALDPLAEEQRELEERWMKDPEGVLEEARGRALRGERQGTEGTFGGGYGGY